MPHAASPRRVAGLSMAMVTACLSAILLGGGCAGRSPTAAHAAPVEIPPAERVYPPDRLAELQAYFQHKIRMNMIQVCYLEAREQTAANPIEGDVTLSMILLPEGKATDVRITRSTIGSHPIEACLVAQVRSWNLGELPARARFTYTIHLAPAY